LVRRHVRRYIGWWEHRTTPLYRRELPSAEVPLIINFGAPIRLFDVADRTRSTELGSFATGACDAHVVVEANGSQGGIQIDFTILGMRLFLGRPLADLTNRGIALDDIFGSAGRRLTSELHDAPNWEARFDLLDCEIALRIAAARQPASEVLCTWKRIVDSGGLATIRSLVEETHFDRDFRAFAGVTPSELLTTLSSQGGLSSA
jgi:hypothetical protein